MTVKQLVEWRPYLDPEATVEPVLDQMLGEDATNGIPVLTEDGRVTGWLSHDAVLREVTRVSRRELAEAQTS